MGHSIVSMIVVVCLVFPSSPAVTDDGRPASAAEPSKEAVTTDKKRKERKRPDADRLPNDVAGTGQGAEADPQEFSFITRLDATLDVGLRNADDHAVAACVALIFCDDATILDRAIEAVRLVGGPARRKVLEKACGILAKRRFRHDTKLALKRMAHLRNMAESAGDGYSFLTICALHLDSERRDTAVIAVIDLKDASSVLRRAFTADKAPPATPELSFWFNVRKQKHRAQSEWLTWIPKADRETLNAAMAKFFAATKAAREQRMRDQGLLPPPTSQPARLLLPPTSRPASDENLKTGQ